MNEKFSDAMKEEYQEFLNAGSVTPPSSVTSQILEYVHRDLNPNAWWIFGKMGLIHLLSGIVTLSLCPQFGIRVFGEGLGLMKAFMVFGRYGCIAACGAFFIGSSILLAGILLNREELRKLRQYQILQLSALILLSLGLFLMADAHILIGYAAAWIVGSLGGGIAMLELSWLVKRRALAAS